MIIEAPTLSPTDMYHLMTQTVVPRPIAWALTTNINGEKYNLAPFSYFNAVCADPPLLMLSVAEKPTGGMKDTATNIMSGQSFVIHIAEEHHLQAVQSSALPLDYGKSEIQHSDINLCNFGETGLQRIVDAPIAFACTLYKHNTIGNNNQQLFFVEITHVHLDERIIEKSTKHLTINTDALAPLARLGLSNFSTLGTVISAKSKETNTN